MIANLFFALIILFSTACADEVENQEKNLIMVLNNDNFKTAVTENEFILVEFYTDWCGRCKVFEPEYIKVAQELAERNSTIKLAKVDATVEQKLVEEYKIKGYPTIKFFDNGLPIDYKGEREAVDIIAWITKQIQPPAKELYTIEETEQFLNDNEIAILGFFHSNISDNAKRFSFAAKFLDNFAFGIVSNATVITNYGAEDNVLILFKPYDDKKAIYTGSLDYRSVKKFVQIQSLPLIIHLSPEYASKVFSDSIKSHLLFFVSKEAGHIEKYVEPLKDIAKVHRENIEFIIITLEVFATLYDFFEVPHKEIPTVRLISFNNGIIKYKPDKTDLSAQVIDEFLNKYTNGELEEHVITQELPEDWDKNHVKVLVGSNFPEVAFNLSNDVLVHFYAPSKDNNDLEIIYDQLGELYKENDTVTIAKMDVTKNEMRYTEVSTVPTIKLFRKFDNEIIQFKLDYGKLDDFVKFLDAGGDILNTDEEEIFTNDEEEQPKKDEL